MDLPEPSTVASPTSNLGSDGGIPEVPAELGRLLQQLFVALEDYINGPPEAMPNLAQTCEWAVLEVARPLRDAHWTLEDTHLLLGDCVRRLRREDVLAVPDERTRQLETKVRAWATSAYGPRSPV